MRKAKRRDSFVTKDLYDEEWNEVEDFDIDLASLEKMTDNLKREFYDRPLKKKMVATGDPIAFTFMFQDSHIAFSTEHNFLIGFNLKSKEHYFITFDKCFVTCLDFTEKKGVLVAGMSNNFVALINPRKNKFTVLRTFFEFSNHPVLAIKFIDGLQKMMFTNSANEIILVERISKKSYKRYKSRLVTRINMDSAVIHDIKVVDLPKTQSSVVAFISVDKVRLVWLNNLKRFKLKFISGINYSQINEETSRLGTSMSMNMSMRSESIIDDQYFRPDVLMQLSQQELRPSKSGRRVSFGSRELKLILKKKNRNLMSDSGVCILERKYDFGENQIFSKKANLQFDQFYLVLTFGCACKIRLYTIGAKGEISEKNQWKLSLSSAPIWGCLMGKNSLFFLFDNFRVSMLLLNQLDQGNNLFDYGEFFEIGRSLNQALKTRSPANQQLLKGGLLRGGVARTVEKKACNP